MAQPLRTSSWPAVPPASRTFATPPTVKLRKNRAAFSMVQNRRGARISAPPLPPADYLLTRQHRVELREDRELYLQSLCNLVAVKQQPHQP